MFNFSNAVISIILAHVIIFVIFAIIYYYLFRDDAEKHFLLNSSHPLTYYKDNKIINSMYLSANLQTTTGYVEFSPKSPAAKIITMTQLLCSAIVTIGLISFSFKNSKTVDK